MVEGSCLCGAVRFKAKAMSGIVNLVTKEGGERYQGSLSFYGGDTFTRHESLYLSPG